VDVDSDHAVEGINEIESEKPFFLFSDLGYWCLHGNSFDEKGQGRFQAELTEEKVGAMKTD
jgi:hypothetical protein